jgi:hypothetical protein
MLHKASATSILRCVVIVGKGFYRFGVLLGLTPLSLIDVLHVIGGGFNIYGSFTFVWFASLGLFCLPRLWSLLFVSFSLAFLGAFF